MSYSIKTIFKNGDDIIFPDRNGTLGLNKIKMNRLNLISLFARVRQYGSKIEQFSIS